MAHRRAAADSSVARKGNGGWRTYGAQRLWSSSTRGADNESSIRARCRRTSPSVVNGRNASSGPCAAPWKPRQRRFRRPRRSRDAALPRARRRSVGATVDTSAPHDAPINDAAEDAAEFEIERVIDFDRGSPDATVARHGRRPRPRTCSGRKRKRPRNSPGDEAKRLLESRITEVEIAFDDRAADAARARALLEGAIRRAVAARDAGVRRLVERA